MFVEELEPPLIFFWSRPDFLNNQILMNLGLLRLGVVA